MSDEYAPPRASLADAPPLPRGPLWARVAVTVLLFSCGLRAVGALILGFMLLAADASYVDLPVDSPSPRFGVLPVIASGFIYGVTWLGLRKRFLLAAFAVFLFDSGAPLAALARTELPGGSLAMQLVHIAVDFLGFAGMRAVARFEPSEG